MKHDSLHLRHLIMSALFAALILISTRYFQFPIPATGGYIHPRRCALPACRLAASPALRHGGSVRRHHAGRRARRLRRLRHSHLYHQAVGRRGGQAGLSPFVSRHSHLQENAAALSDQRLRGRISYGHGLLFLQCRRARRWSGGSRQHSKRLAPGRLWHRLRHHAVFPLGKSPSPEITAIALIKNAPCTARSHFL